MKKLALLLFFLVNISAAQTNDTLFIAFWNLENLFDTYDDPLIDDAEYLPQSVKQWDSVKLDLKMKNLAEVINLMNDGKGPDVLGVCEIENEEVLIQLSANYLDGRYSIAHLESPDNRGIDNGLLFDNTKFRLLSEQGDTVTLPDGYPTRLIFGASLLIETDTLHFFVNHWPSRRSGEAESEVNRITAAGVLRSSVDELFALDPDAGIFILGDFNDEPGDISLAETLKAKPFNCDTIPAETNVELYNLSYEKYLEGEGTYKYQNDWNMLDQVIVSGSLLKGELLYLCETFEIFKPVLMITEKGKYAGTARPTFGGKNYLGGYSDHFPVTAKFIRSK